MTDPLNHETWQHLLGLESVDVVCEWHQKICNLELNTRRAVEITSSAKQAREYFRNAANSANTVRPLLTFYGVTSLARSTLLLLKPRNGEESITKGHGLETVDWSRTLSGDLSTALKTMGELKIRSCSGLFNDFLTQTNNRICMHIRSAAVDWRLTYQLPSHGEELTLAALLSTIPDLEKVVPESGHNPSYASVNELTYSHAEGFVAKVDSKKIGAFGNSYTDLGYEFTQDSGLLRITCDNHTFENSTPQFMHTYVNKMFDAIPTLHIVKPIRNDIRFSQLSITYALAYILGMLARYFPTQWIALHSGAKGDGLWPAIHAAQNYVELAFPELIIELIHDMLADRERNVS